VRTQPDYRGDTDAVFILDGLSELGPARAGDGGRCTAGRACGLRVSSVAALAFDCVVASTDGVSYLRYCNIKMNAKRSSPSRNIFAARGARYHEHPDRDVDEEDPPPAGSRDR
jgi:hypothetical protein